VSTPQQTAANGNDEPLIGPRSILPVVVTLAAMLSGFLAILVTILGMAKDEGYLIFGEPPFLLAAKLIMLAMILDGLDGNIARWLKGSSAFGAELDTYVDLTAFGIAPAILIFAVTFQTKDDLIRILLPSAVALSGVVRLARFKVKDPLRGQGGYAGLPITANGAWVAVFVLLNQVSEGRFALDHGWVATGFLLGIMLFITLQVTNVRYPKPTKNAFLFVPCVLLVIGLLVPHRTVAAGSAITVILLGLAYIFIGPFFVKGVEARRARMEAQLNGTANVNPPTDS
jgi:CDP-diacylglycerol--serine O-phosphatidyltransferase